MDGRSNKEANMLYTGALLYAELYDTMSGPYTDVRAVWEKEVK